MEGSLSPADVAVLSGNRNGSGYGFGDGGAWWIIIFLIFAMGWRGNGFNGNDGGNSGMSYYINSDVQRGFDQSALLNGIAGINNSLSDLSRQACDNRFDVVTAINNSGFENRTGLMSLQSQLAQCCCDNRASIADLKYTVATENCADREALSNGIRDIITANTANTQAILDKLCAQEIEAKNDTIAQLRTQLNMANLAASQSAQNNLITQGFANEVDALYNRLNACPVPTTPVYGRTPIFTCNNSCGCGGSNFI